MVYFYSHRTPTRLKKLMEQDDVSVAALAEYARVTQHTIRNWLTGRSYPGYESIVKMAQMFDLDMADELFEEPMQKPILTKTSGSSYFAYGLLKLMNEYDVTVEELCDGTDISKACILRYVLHISAIGTENELKLCEFFDCSLNQLRNCYEEEQPKQEQKPTQNTFEFETEPKVVPLIVLNMVGMPDGTFEFRVDAREDLKEYAKAILAKGEKECAR